jgi:hypothetical protein
MSKQQPDLARQALGRPLNAAEIRLAEALVAIFATGQHDFGAVAAHLEAHGVAVPSGADGPWTVASLHGELLRINASLDAAYDAGGFVEHV